MGETTNGGLALIEWRSALLHSCRSPLFFSLIFISFRSLIVYPFILVHRRSYYNGDMGGQPSSRTILRTTHHKT